jgi:polysaccharide biosynthesis/export protein
MKLLLNRFVTVAMVWAALATPAAAQQPAPPTAPPAVAGGVALPSDYVIGTDDVLSIVFWREKDMSADVVVRPDGRISLPLLNDIDAAGQTPDQLRAVIVKAAAKFVTEPNATVVVKEIHSRKVFITGQVAKPGSYPLSADMTVMQVIALGGGLLEYADAKGIVVIRKEDGREKYFKFNYRDVLKGKNVQQNILLKLGDTVVVP